MNHAGIRVHLGKTQCWAKGGGEAPEGIATLDVPGEDPVWKGNLAPEKNGVAVLGTILGNHSFVHAKGEKRLKEERKLLDALPQLPDLQCAWLLLYFSAVPRANHLLRAVPPNLVHSYAQRHDNEVWRTLLALLNRKPSAALERKKQRAQLPCRLGG